MELNNSFIFTNVQWRKPKGWRHVFALCLALCICTLVGAQSPNKQITVVSQNEPLANVLKKVEKASGYKVIFTYDEVQQYNVSVSAVNQPVSTALQQILKNLPFKYTVKGKFIHITKTGNNTSQSASVNQPDKGGSSFLGQVVDVDGEPLPGVSVVFKDKKSGTVTDVNGKFEFPTDQEYANLIFSFLGKKSIEKTVRRDKSVRIVMDDDNTMTNIDEVVVIGYGTAKQKDLTGAVSRISRSEIEAAPMTNNIQSMLQGEASGVNVMIADASPTSRVSVIIRGLSSLSGNGQPLWVIDGIPQYTDDTSADVDNTLYNLNLNDVESVDILKDASATAIYGSRAANGVVLVTTRSGVSGSKPKIEFSGRYGFQKISTDFRSLNTEEYIEFMKRGNIEEAFRSGGLTWFNTEYFMDYSLFKANCKTSQWGRDEIANIWLPNAFYGGHDDWWNLMTTNAPVQDYNISARGGSSSTSYYVSLNYKDQEGIVKGSQSNYLGLHLNLETMVSNKLKLGVNATLSGRTADNKDNLISRILDIRPDFPAYNEDGSYFTTDSYTTNPFLVLKDTNRSKSRQIQTTAFLEYNIFPFLKFRTTGNVNYQHYSSDLYTTVKYNGANNTHSMASNDRTSFVWDNLLTFYKTFDRHDVTAMAGTSMERFRYETLSAEGRGFPDDDVLTNLTSATTKQSMESDVVGHSLASAFARIQYKYNNRYLITGTYRADGSSRFGKDSRWGYFPSAAVGYIITEEEFMKPLQPILSYMKLRASWGKTGSQNLGYYDFLSRYKSKAYDGKPATYPSSLGNDILQWESQKQTDVGVDFGLFNDRIHGSIGWYKKYVDNLLYSVPIPTSSAFTSITQNIGAISNRGWEFDVSADIMRTKDLRWTFKFNAATNKGKVEKINGVKDEITSAYNKLTVGNEIGTWYGYQDAGRLFKNEEEVWAIKPIDAKTGNQNYYRDSNEGAGDVYVVDQDGDGKLTDKDKVDLGSSVPKVFGGFSNVVQWKGLRVSLNFAYSIGGLRLFYEEMRKYNEISVWNAPTSVLKSWIMVGPDAEYPFTSPYGRGNNGVFTNRWLYDASYLRLNALNVNYRLPATWFKKTFVDNIELGFQTTNVFTITKYPGMDPQGNFSVSTNMAMQGLGRDESRYPPARTFNFSVKITFD